MQNSYDYPLSLSSYSSRLVYNRIFGTIFKRDLSRVSLSLEHLRDYWAGQSKLLLSPPTPDYIIIFVFHSRVIY